MVAGTLFFNTSENGENSEKCFFVQNDNSIHVQLKKNWAIEDTPNEDRAVTWTKDEQFCEEHFFKKHTRNHTDRFTVSLPLRDKYADLGNTFDLAQIP